MANDRFAGNAPALGSPADDAAAVVPADGADIATVSKALFVGGAGNLVVDTFQGNTVTFTGVTAGTILPLRVKRVRATGTTATNIVALL